MKSLKHKSVFWIMATYYQCIIGKGNAEDMRTSTVLSYSLPHLFLSINVLKTICVSWPVRQLHYFKIINIFLINIKCVPIGPINCNKVKYIYLYRFIFKFSSHINPLYQLNVGLITIRTARGMVSSPMTPLSIVLEILAYLNGEGNGNPL